MRRRAGNTNEEDFIDAEMYDGEDDKMEEDNEQINVDIFLENQSENDYLEIKNFLLHSGLKYTGINLRSLTDILIQTEIGSVIKSSDNETFGLAIPVDLDVLLTDNIANTLTQYTINSFNQHNQQQTQLITDILQGKRGKRMLVVNERMINCPTDLNHLLHHTIYEEVDIFLRDNNIKDTVKYYILVASCVKSVESDEQNDDEEQVMTRRKKKVNVSDELEFLLMENQIYYKHAEASVVVPVSAKDRWTLPGKVKDFISIMFINANQIPSILNEIADAFGKSQFMEE